jgi:hypothetical protein
VVAYQRGGALSKPVRVGGADFGEPMQLIAADFDGSGRAEIAAGTLVATWLIEPGSGEPARRVGPRALDFELADANADGRVDLLAAYGSLLTRQFVNEAGEWSAQTTEVPDRAYAGFGVGDLTGDGVHDWALALSDNRPESRLDVIAGGQDAEPAPPAVSHASYDLPQPVEVVDLDRDGRSDVVTVHGGWERVGVYLQRPEGGLQDEQLFPVPYRTHYPLRGLAAGDLDCDGRLDLATVSTGVVVLRQPRAEGASACRPPAAATVAVTARRAQRVRRLRARVACSAACLLRVRVTLVAGRRTRVVRTVRRNLAAAAESTVRARLGAAERSWVARARRRGAVVRAVFRARAAFAGGSTTARRVVRVRR